MLALGIPWGLANKIFSLANTQAHIFYVNGYSERQVRLIFYGWTNVLTAYQSLFLQKACKCLANVGKGTLSNINLYVIIPLYLISWH